MNIKKPHYPILVVVVVAVLFSLLSPEIASASTYCDSVQFIADVSVPDGTVLKPGEAFTKTWRLGNNGSCAWSTGYALVYISGDRLGGPDTLSLPVGVAPGSSIDLSVKMAAPSVAGHYRASWKLKNASGALFGLGSSANQGFWVDINVVDADSAVYDFTTNAGYAEWLSGYGKLVFPAESGDYRGYAMAINAPHLEDGSVDTLPGLLTVPQNKYDGYIQATYPELLIHTGDHFQTTAGCEYGATSCYVTYRLDAIAPAGRKTLWTWKEKYDSRFYRVDIDLSSLAGQKVKFVLMLLASGDANGDRALWGAPRIIRGSGGLSPLPTFTPTMTPFAPPPTVTLSDCNKASLVADVTIPYGTPFSPGVAFTKTWRLKNIGSCTWTTAYSLVFQGGEQMSAPPSIALQAAVDPGQTVDVSVNMVAPPAPGTYTGSWALRDPSGVLFGVFVQGPSAFMVNIDVTGATVSQTGYDFAANYCSARWIAGSFSLPCPGTDGDARGAVLKLDAPKMEDGSTASAPGLLTLPQNKTDGYIMGEYPAIAVQAGDVFDADLGCQFGATSCFVTYRLDYLTPGGTTKIFWTWKEKYEGKFYHASVNLTPLAGQSVRFVLTVLASGPASGDRALWGNPHITRAAPSVSPPTVVPPAVVSSPDIRHLYMIDATNGWAIGSSYLLRTSDGGVTWYNVGMPGVSLQASHMIGSFLNAASGWLLVDPTGDDSAGGLYRTTNGGASWVHYATPILDAVTLQFLDNNIGFVMAGSGIGMNKQPVYIYETTNGGASWVRNFAHDPALPDNGLPVSGHKYGMVFRDISHGWINGDVPMDGFFYLYTTANSGVTWAQQQLAFPAGYEGSFVGAGVVHFFGANDAVLPVWIGSKTKPEKVLFIYSTHNGGTSWTFSSASAGPVINADFVSIRDGFGWDPAGMFRVTNNAGVSWRSVTPNVAFANVQGMDFVSTSVGWVLDQNASGNLALYRSLDGGKTWSLLHGAAPMPSATATITATPTPFGPSATPLPGLVTNVSVNATAPAVCTPDNQVYITGAITTSAAVNITYHWEVGGDSVQGVTPDTQMSLPGAGTTTINFPAYPYTPQCGNYFIKLIVSSPAEVFGMATFSLFPATSTPDVNAPPTATATMVAPTATETPAAPTATPEPTSTSTPAGSGPYAVWQVRSWQLIYLRSEPRSAASDIGTLSPNATDVMLTGNTGLENGAILWVEVKRADGLTGWTLPYNLTEYLTRDAFCADPRVLALLGQLKQALIQSDGSAFAALVNAHHGLDVRLLSAMPGMNFTAVTAANLFQDSNDYVWFNDETGVHLDGTFASIVQPRLLSVLNDPAEQTSCDDYSRLYPASTFWSEFYNGTHFYAVYRPGTPGVDADYAAWLAGIDYVNHVPYLSSLTQFSSQP